MNTKIMEFVLGKKKAGMQETGIQRRIRKGQKKGKKRKDLIQIC